jgi:ElaB/YqjD/DUF883 family membrane-anchored ribosome-binding protein
MSADTTSSYGSTRGSASGNPGQQTTNPKGSVSDALGRGGAGIAQSAGAAGESLAEDVGKLRADLASMQQTMMKFMADAGDEAAKSARNVGQAVASQMGAATSDFVQAGSEMASQAKDQMKTFASELESTARKNPLGTLAATLVVGVVIGMMSRGRN